MIDEHELILLKNFFGAYFHEDWSLEAENFDGIVANYANISKSEDLRSLSKTIMEYSNMFTIDSELKKNLFTELGCYYSPSGDGLSAKAWLERVAKQLFDSSVISR